MSLTKCNLTLAMSPTCQSNNTTLIIDREAREIMYLVASVCPSVCPSVRPSVRPLTAEPFDLRPWNESFWRKSWAPVHIKFLTPILTEISIIVYDLWSSPDRKRCIWAHRTDCTGGLRNQLSILWVVNVPTAGEQNVSDRLTTIRAQPPIDRSHFALLLLVLRNF